MKTSLAQAVIGASLNGLASQALLEAQTKRETTPPVILVPSEEGLDLASMRYLNESAIKQHALTCAARCRPKFTRVSKEFVDEVKADVEAFIRELRNNANREVAPFGCIEPSEDTDFLTGALIEKLKPILNKTVARIIQSKVQRQTTGKTLGATR